MLTRLSVRNFAIIDRIDLEFGPGMTVLTGETGAGKSLLIDAVSLLAGDRASQDMIRGGSDRAELEVVFSDPGERASLVLDRNGIDHGEGNVRIRREIVSKGNGTIRVNDRPVTLQQLREIAACLVDVHTQFDSQRLLDPAGYVDLIDAFLPERTVPAREAYAMHLREYARRDAAWRDLLHEAEEYDRNMELYRHQLSELTAFGLDAGEEDALREEHAVLANFDKIDTGIRTARSIFDEKDLLGSLYEAGDAFDRIASYTQDFARLKERLRDAYYELDDIRGDFDRRLRELDFDADRNTAVETRLAAIEGLVRKYRKPVGDLILLRDELARKIDHGDNREGYLAQAEAERREEYHALRSAAADLTSIRREIAARVESGLVAAFADLCLPGTRFHIEFDGGLPENPVSPETLAGNGADRLEFLISTNVGEPERPLARTASGGETSRIMLAFKTIFVKSQRLSTIVFDEIDTGISGMVARQIARKIRSVSASCQVIAISHVPQVVAAADRQVHVVKSAADGRTTASASELTFADRIRVLAEMLSGTTDSIPGTAQAKELLLGE
jgi:DNA repair protein RecN (Recombination protein N)